MSEIDLHEQELSVQGMIADIAEATRSTHPKRFCFVLGAGASYSSGILTGEKMVEKWDQELRDRNACSHEEWLAEKKINLDNMASFYSDFYDRRYGRNPEDGYAFLEKEMEHAKPRLGYIMLAYILANTPHNVVITTNFDHLVENALSEYTHTMPMVIGHEAIAHHVRLPICRPTIIKIHRDLLLDPKSEGAQLNELDPKWEKPLTKIIENYHPIFVGYAGNDPSLMDFLNANSGRFANNEWKCPYWTLYNDEPIRDKVGKFLQGSMGYYTRSTGFDDLMCLIGATLDCKLPKKEAYIADIEERHDALMKQYETFIAAQRKQPASTPTLPTVEEKTMSKTTTSTNPSGTPASDVDKAVGQALEKIAGENDPQRRYSEASNLYHAGEYEDAEAILQSLVKEFPKNDRYLNMLGITLEKLGRYQDAVNSYKKAIALNPDEGDYHFNLGNALDDLGHHQDAVGAYKKAIALNPDKGDYHSNLGVVLYYLERYPEAKEAFEKAHALAPDDPAFKNPLA